MDENPVGTLTLRFGDEAVTIDPSIEGYPEDCARLDELAKKMGWEIRVHAKAGKIAVSGENYGRFPKWRGA